MSYITKSQTHNLPFLPNLFFTFCMAIIMIACGNTCRAQEKERFILVKSMSEIMDGDTVIIANDMMRANQGYPAMGSGLNKNNQINVCKIDIDGEIATVSSYVDRIKLEQVESGKNTFWRLFSIKNQKYICNDSNRNTYENIKYRDKNDDDFKTSAKATIEIHTTTNNIYTKIIYPRNATFQKRILIYSNKDDDFIG